MLEIKVEGTELFDENTQEFITVKPQVLKLEHSLVSLSKWESRWHKPFLSREEHTSEESLDYVRCMTINKVDDYIYLALTSQNSMDIKRYVDDSMTATTVKDIPGKKNNEVITSELIYYWMVTFNIPFECEKWHLNRLLTLIKVCNAKNQPAKNMSKREVLSQNRAINRARKSKYHTRG